MVRKEHRLIRFYCECGAPVYFDDHQCLSCGSRIGFDPDEMKFRIIADNSAKQYPICRNGKDYGVCNWIAHPKATEGLCLGCQFNRFIPNLGKPENISRWNVLERAKKRLLFSLMRLGILIKTGHQSPDDGLLFDFLENQSSNPTDPAKKITTGYLRGVITINVLEAEPVARVEQKVAANEVYRTVLGHMRHESGHYLWSKLEGNSYLTKKFRNLFGEENEDYNEALKTFYQHGARQNWAKDFITHYASSHPLEDWAETWGHYIHITDGIETAENFGLVTEGIGTQNFATKIETWQSITIKLNEMNRSMGKEDLYPFTINEITKEKLMFADDVISLLNSEPNQA